MGGPILTLAEPPVAEALWIVDGRIAAVGTEAEVQAAIRAGGGPEPERVELDGQTLMPGLIEVHTHPLLTAQLGQTIDVSGFSHGSREELMDALEAGARGIPLQPWIVAYGWDPMIIPDLEPPTRAELDAIAPERPLLVLTQMAHDAYVNSAALEAAGITRDTPDPPGGAFLRDASGELTGALHEVNAIDAVSAAMPPVDPAVSALLLRWQYGSFAAAGYTTLGVLGPVGRADDPLAMMAALADDPHVGVRVVTFGLPEQLEDAGIQAPPKAPEHGRFILSGVKFWMDGSPFTGGAALEQPYASTPLVREQLGLEPGHRGELNYDREGFEAKFERYHRAGFQIAVHAQGERAVGMVLDVAEAVLARHPRDDHRHRLEHNALITRAQMQRARELGVELSFFAEHVRYYGHRLPQLVGDRVERYMPVAEAIELGHRATLHSDNPTTPVGPFRVVQTAVLRLPLRGGEGEPVGVGIEVEQAIRAITLDAAYQLGVDHELGSLEVGKRADLALLSDDPLSMAPEALETIEVRQTWLDGQPVDTRKASMVHWSAMLQAFAALVG